MRAGLPVFNLLIKTQRQNEIYIRAYQIKSPVKLELMTAVYQALYVDD